MRPGIEAMNVEEQVVIRIGSGNSHRANVRAHAFDLSRVELAVYVQTRLCRADRSISRYRD